jgi:hypothetical protein
MASRWSPPPVPTVLKRRMIPAPRASDGAQQSVGQEQDIVARPSARDGTRTEPGLAALSERSGSQRVVLAQSGARCASIAAGVRSTPVADLAEVAS